MPFANPNGFSTVLVTGGGGYVGSALVPTLLERGYRVKVIDLFWYGRDVFGRFSTHANLTNVVADIRNPARLAAEFKSVDAVIHLACISNDPSFELDPGLGKSINFDCFAPLLQAAIDGGVRRFIYASSSSIYRVKAGPTSARTPRRAADGLFAFQVGCERVAGAPTRGMERVISRPATVCGYAPAAP